MYSSLPNTNPNFAQLPMAGINPMHEQQALTQALMPLAAVAQPSAYAHGGKIKRGKLIISHFNPHELDTLDELQGKRESCPRSGMRSYSHLEELLKNPHILRGIHHHTQQHAAHRAAGGAMHDYHNPQLNQMASSGIHGDSELALIGPHTKSVLDNLLRSTGNNVTVNPQTAHPQYFGLGDILGGISGALGKLPLVGGLASGLVNGIGGLAKSAAPMLGGLTKAAAPILGEVFGGPIGGMAGDALGGLAGNAVTSFLGGGGGQQAPAHQQQASGMGRMMGHGPVQNPMNQGRGMMNNMMGQGRGMMNQGGYGQQQGGYGQQQGGYDQIEDVD